jgi:hypothetical protein
MQYVSRTQHQVVRKLQDPVLQQLTSQLQTLQCLARPTRTVQLLSEYRYWESLPAWISSASFSQLQPLEMGARKLHRLAQTMPLPPPSLLNALQIKTAWRL